MIGKWVFTRDERYLVQWDNFVSSVEDSSFLQKTHRLNSYKKYKCKFELQILLDPQDKIIAGSANLVIEYSFFKIYFCSYGPLVCSLNLDDVSLVTYASEFVNRSKVLKCFSAQLSLPLGLKNKVDTSDLLIGTCFHNIAIQNKLNLISLVSQEGHKKNKDDLIAGFTPNGRRDVRASYRKGLISRLVSNGDEIKEAYEFIASNAKIKGYVVRTWEDFGCYLISGVEKGDVHILTAFSAGQMMGAIVLEKSSNCLNYTIGGIRRSKPDMQTGYFLQLEGMMHATKLGLKYYNISHGGPADVMKFKSQFNPVLIESSFHAHSINNIFIYKLYEVLSKVNLKKYLMTLYGILKKI